MDKKKFALHQIAPYVRNPALCGIDGSVCRYLTADGRMCVAGKNMNSPGDYLNYSINAVIAANGQRIFKATMKAHGVNDMVCISSFEGEIRNTYLAMTEEDRLYCNISDAFNAWLRQGIARNYRLRQN